MTSVRGLGATFLLAALLAGCSSPQPNGSAATPDLSHSWAAKVTADGMFTHLRALRDIANAHQGSRAAGTSGYEASVEYVAKALQDKGFEVSTPQFDRLSTVSPGKPILMAGGHSYPVDQASLLVRTPPGGLTGQLVRPAQPAGWRAQRLSPRRAGRCDSGG